MIGTTTLLEVATLGRFEVRRQQETLVGGNWNRRKIRELFKLLLCGDQHRLHREQIQEILWPESTSEQATNSFGKTLYLLRRALEPDLVAGKGSASTYILLDGDTLILLPENIRVDADIFEASAKQLQITLRNRTGKEIEVGQETLLSEFDRILALYQGDFLPEDLYEDWSQRRRDRLRRTYSWLLENAADLALSAINGQRASEYLQTLLEQNTADEQTHRKLMLTYARMGRRSEALNQYQLLREALREELHANPLPETVELYRAIQSGRINTDLQENRASARTVPEIRAEQTERADIALVDREISVNLQDLQRVPERKQLEGIPASAVTPEDVPVQIDSDRILNAGLVGREEELRRLQRAYSQASNGQKRVLFISGESGIGKTRLARDFTHWSEVNQQATILWGYSYEMSGLLPYQSVAEAISSYVRLCSAEQLRTLLGESAADLAKIAPDIRLKLTELVQPESLSPEMDRRNLYNAVARFFTMLSRERPLIVILDDLQWADAATVHLLNFLTTQASGMYSTAPTPLFLMLYRGEEVHEIHPLRGLIASLARIGAGEELRLQRLTEEVVERLLVNMAGHAVRSEFSSEIYKQTEGNPFFIGEVIRSLILEGKLKQVDGRWQSQVQIDQLGIPQSVRLLIERRLGNLSADCRTTLSFAAVMGREFSSSLLCLARKLPEDVVAEHIDSAIQAQLLSSLHEMVPRLEPGTGNTGRATVTGKDLDLSFTHDKIREVLYQWLNPLRKRSLHRQVAQALEERYASSLQPYYSTLAYHYQMAEDSTRAVDYLLKAAQVAGSVYAFLDATNYVKAALDLLIGLDERPMRATLLYQLSESSLYLGKMDEAIQSGLAAAVLWHDLGESKKEAEAYLHVAFCSHWQGRELEAIKYIETALACLADRPEEISLLAKAYVQWGLAATVIGDVPLAREKLQQASELDAQLGGKDAFISIVSLWSLSWCACLAGSPLDMLSYALRAVETCRSFHRPEWEPMMNYSAAWACMLLGRIAEGEQLARQALQKAQQHGVVGAIGWAYLAQSFLSIQSGELEKAMQAADSAYATGTMLHDLDLQSRAYWSRSVCAGWQGNWEEAMSNSKQALQLANQEGDLSMVYPHLLVQAAKACFYFGRLEEAQQYLTEGVALATQRQYHQLLAIAQRIQGLIWQTQGKLTEAEDCFERSLTALAAIDDAIEHARTEEAYGLYLQTRQQEGDSEHSAALLYSASTTFKRLGVKG